MKNVIENQEKKRDFVNNNILGNVTCEVAYILEKSLNNNPDNYPPFGYDDIQNLYYTENDEDVKNKNADASDMKEVFEWYLISSFASHELEKHNEIIIDAGITHYWGRQCSGQAIYLDSVIENIVNDIN